MQDTGQNGDLERLVCFQLMFHSLRWVIRAQVSFIMSLMLTNDQFSSSPVGLEMAEIHWGGSSWKDNFQWLLTNFMFPPPKNFLNNFKTGTWIMKDQLTTFMKCVWHKNVHSTDWDNYPFDLILAKFKIHCLRICIWGACRIEQVTWHFK